MKNLKEYVPYVYKCQGALIIDVRTGCATSFNPKLKGDNSVAKSKSN